MASTDPIQLLERRWIRLAAGPADQALHRWATRPDGESLAAFETVGQLERTIDRCRRTESDPYLTPIVAAARERDEIATTFLTYRFLPAVKSVIRQWTARGTDLEDVTAEAVAALYERITTYPLERRPAAIGCNIAVDLRNRVSAALTPRATTPRTEPIIDDELPVAAVPTPTGETLLSIACDAHRRGTLRHDDARLLALSALGHRPGQLAATFGRDRSVLVRRLQRITTTLAGHYDLDVA